MNIEHGQIDIEQAKAELERHWRDFETLAGLLVEHNRKMNLTRITEPQQIRVRHFLDSLVALQSLDKLAAGRADFYLADIGSGAGFPSLPLAIARPSWKIVSIEAAGKKAGFQRLAADALGLKNFNVVIGRAEELAHDENYRQKFDAVCARAVADTRILAELCLAFVRVGGAFLVWKGPDVKTELRAAGPAIEQLGGSVKNVMRYSLQEEVRPSGQTFQLIYIHKNRKSLPNLPRGFAAISKKPL